MIAIVLFSMTILLIIVASYMCCKLVRVKERHIPIEPKEPKIEKEVMKDTVTEERINYVPEEQVAPLVQQAPIKEEKKDLSLKEMIEKLINQNKELEKEKKTKGWKLPWKAKLSKGKARKGYAVLQIIRDNGEVDFIKAPIEDGTVMVDGMPRAATIDYRLTYKGKPWYIIPAWSLKPFSPIDNMKSMEEQHVTSIAARRLTLAKIEKEQIKPKKGLGGIGGYIIIGIVVIAVIGYMLTGGKLF